MASEAALADGVEAILRSESWDSITVKKVLRKLEASLLPGEPEGCLKPQKKFIKETVDATMTRILAERAAGGEDAAEQPQAADSAAGGKEGAQGVVGAEAAAAAEAEAPPAAEAEPPPMEESATDAPVDADTRAGGEAGADGEAAAEGGATGAAPQPARKRKLVRDDDDDDDDGGGHAGGSAANGAAEGAAVAEGAGEDEEDEDEDEEDEDAPRVVGSPTHKADGKLFYQKMRKGGEVLATGQDVYLENNDEQPYVARLQEIFTYAFAPTEVYFNARWYYREADCHEYARMEGAGEVRGREGHYVEYDGGELYAEPRELFFSLHMDENHADCILRSCTVYLKAGAEAPPSEQWAVVRRHEYLAWRAYDKARVHPLNDLPSRKLRDAYTLEARRTPALRPADARKKRARYDDDGSHAHGPLSAEEMKALWLPRRDMLVWSEVKDFKRVVIGAVVRACQVINGARTFYAGLVVAVRRAARPYRIGERVVESTLVVRASAGERLVGLDALSNEPPLPAELARFTLPIEPRQARIKLSALQQATLDHSELFDDAELKRKEEHHAKLNAQREAEAAKAHAAEEERDRKEREREEVRRRAAERTANSDQWWLKYSHKGESKERELAKWRARLKRFEKIANDSTEAGERENATRLVEQTRAKIEALETKAGADDE